MDTQYKIETNFTFSKECHQCYCVGPQNGSPVCPCRMKNVKVRDGRYYEEIDLGPVKKHGINV